MATKRVKAKLLVAGQILTEFAGTHHLDDAGDFHAALLLLDQAIAELETVSENLSLQIDGSKTRFQTSQPFTTIRVVLNGLEQTEGIDADYVTVDSTHIQFYRPLKTTETVKIEYVLAEPN
jgi:hypothetical protein